MKFVWCYGSATKPRLSPTDKPVIGIFAQYGIRDAVASGVRSLISFANGIRQDYSAVRNALSSIWSNGQVEGQVNRLKFIKRMMYGRANFDLLRKRVLYQPVTI